MNGILFIDPASRSTGWAYFEQGVLREHGTVESSLPLAIARLSELYQAYLKLGECLQPGVVVVEQMNRSVNYLVVWSAAVLNMAIYDSQTSGFVCTDFKQQSPSTWKAWLTKNNIDRQSLLFGFTCKSEDEATAIAMGAAFYGLKLENL